METRQALQIITLAEQGSYAKAADVLGISQSALTQSIARFEREIGVALFDRGRFGARPTEACDLLLQRAQAMLLENRLAHAELDAFRGATRGDLRIGVGKSVVQHLMPRALARFARMRPHVIVTALEGWSPDLFAQLLRGELDFVVSAAVPSASVDPALSQIPLFEQHEVVVVGKSHPLAQQEEVKLADLVDQLWLVPPAGTGRAKQLQTMFQRAGLPAPVRFLRTDSVTLLFEMVRLGAAVGWATVELMAGNAELGVTSLHVKDLAITRTASISLRKRTRPSPLAALLISEIKRIAAMDTNL